MFTFRPIESAASIVAYHKDSLADYYTGETVFNEKARWLGKLRGLILKE